MKTKLHHGLRLVPSYASVEYVNDTKRTDYTATFFYDKFNLTSKFESICVYGFGINNAMCMN